MQEQAFAVTVDYGRSLKEAIQAGKYDWANDYITGENFPSIRSGVTEVEIVLVLFEPWTRPEAVLEEMTERGLRPAELQELLAFGAAYPDVQRKYPVLAIGSEWRNPLGEQFYPKLDVGRDGRIVSIRRGDDGLGASNLIAAVRKQ